MLGSSLKMLIVALVVHSFEIKAFGVSEFNDSPEETYLAEDAPALDSSVDINGDITNILFYQNRYALGSTSKKLVDNRGLGFEDLYGVRNFRVVLNGVLYRSGANNKYNKYGTRSNSNPLPTIGLSNLCDEGFSNVYYMYSTNYDKNKSLVKCTSVRGANPHLQNTMNYKQLGPMDAKSQYRLLKVVYDTLMDANAGPVLFHCWNGWHASGLISALALRQFCNYTGAQAVRYWDQNTDGNNTAKGYESFRNKIRNFVPYQDLKISPEAQRLVCLSAK